MLGDYKKNKWCCFCVNWFDPACSALTPRIGSLFIVDEKKRAKCMAHKYETKALATCPQFKSKF